MSAEVLLSDPLDPDPHAVAVAAQALIAGKLVILPTETVYGLACRADDEAALQRLTEAKGRASDKALPIVLPHPAMLSQVARVTVEAQQLATAYMPGPVTLVLPRLPQVSPLVTGGRDTVGVRVPDLPLTRAILAACGLPVVATSANLAGEAPATSVSALSSALREAVALIVDGGPCPGGEASTVVDLTVQPPAVLRVGPVSEEDIQAVLRRGR
ncbi:threonylcarbamoyl-AMP synthase [bacterium]|nr:threonylcarbamoyl-AMP synthase [bacterium]